MKVNRITLSGIFILLSAFILTGCGSKSGDGLNAGAGKMEVVPHPPGYPEGDTIDWRTVPEDYRPRPTFEGARELPGKKLGLIGPIIAEGGSGGKSYIVVYDAAGTFVGAIYKKEAKKNPEALRILLEDSLKRSEHQNRFSLEKMRQNGVLDR